MLMYFLVNEVLLDNFVEDIKNEILLDFSLHSKWPKPYLQSEHANSNREERNRLAMVELELDSGREGSALSDFYLVWCKEGW